MLCPNCHIDHPEDIHECPKCGLVLGKWHGGKVSAGHAIGSDRERKSSPVVLYGGLFVVAAAYFAFFRGGSVEEAESSPAPVPAAALSTAPATQEPAEPWTFDGRVTDVRKAVPVANAQINMVGAGRTFKAVTDGSGMFHLEVPSLHSGGYEIRITHPQYKAQWIVGSPELMPEELRARTTCPRLPVPETFTSSSSLQLMLCPRR